MAGFPNLWLVTGPNSGVATTSVVFMIEQTVGFILQTIKASGIDLLVGVKRKAQDAYNDKIHRAMAQTVWLSGCKSYYIHSSGRVTTLYPGNAKAFRRQMRKIRRDDFNFTAPPLITASAPNNLAA